MSGSRHALVIGNSDYAQAGKLRNLVNDADARERSLKNLGCSSDLLSLHR